MSAVRRIVLSDSESDDDVALVQATPASTAKSNSSAQNSGGASSSSSKSARAATYSESKRLMAMNEMKAKMGRGLKGALSSDEEYSGSSSDSDDDNWEFSANVKGATSSKGSPRSSSSVKRGSMGGRAASFFAGGKSDWGDKNDDDNEYDDDFIVGSDEEREEEEERAAAAAKVRAKEKKARQKRREEKEKHKKAERAKNMSPRDKSLAVDSEGNPIKRIVLDDDDEEEEEEERNEESHANSDKEQSSGTESSDNDVAPRLGKRSSHSKKSSKKRQRHNETSSDDDDEEESDDSAIDGPMLYWQVDAMRNEQRDMNTDEVLHMRQSFSPEEAMTAYIELLARSHLNNDAIQNIMEDPSLPAHSRLLSASRQIENKICTMRESLLGSGAWAGGGSTFARELQTRPFYVPGGQIDALGDNDEKCAACNRTSKTQSPYAVYLFGYGYDAREVWMSNRWVDLMPSCLFHHYQRRKLLKEEEKERRKQNNNNSDVIELDESESGSDNSSSSDDDNDDDENECDSDLSDGQPEANARCQWWIRKWPGALTQGNESRWQLSGHCKGRTQLYHAMLHYKFRLLLKIRERLEVHNYSLGALLQDQVFINHETRRYADLLDLASTQFGGSNMDASKEASIRSLWKDGETDNTPRKSSQSGERSSSDTKHQSGMLNFLVRADRMA
jgi:hypothetical protein